MKKLYEGDLGFKDLSGDIWTLEAAITIEAKNIEEAETLIVSMWDLHKYYVKNFHECTPIARRLECIEVDAEYETSHRQESF